jgi:hypothetical protein
VCSLRIASSVRLIVSLVGQWFVFEKALEENLVNTRLARFLKSCPSVRAKPAWQVKASALLRKNLPLHQLHPLTSTPHPPQPLNDIHQRDSLVVHASLYPFRSIMPPLDIFSVKKISHRWMLEVFLFRPFAPHYITLTNSFVVGEAQDQ